MDFIKKEFRAQFVSVAQMLVFLGLVLLAISVRDVFFSGAPILSVAETKQMVKELGGSENDPPIILFKTSWCGYCRATAKELESLQVKFVQADIETNATAQRLYAKYTNSFGGVPRTIIGTKIISGYNPPKIREAVRQLLAETSPDV